ncbi:hypothetical protein CRG98_005624 [Punica granatum]|uniref:Uncharacterized protein n=1 Tax=Punica granatum TaxID=22663 RepID=A0A2I0KZV1_PUNGR|nr:hypothetical protein CRG98_005624 [Punica granatum]
MEPPIWSPSLPRFFLFENREGRGTKSGVPSQPPLLSTWLSETSEPFNEHAEGKGFRANLRGSWGRMQQPVEDSVPWAVASFPQEAKWTWKRVILEQWRRSRRG